MGRRESVRPKIDPDLLRKLFETYEEICVLMELWINSPIGTRGHPDWQSLYKNELLSCLEGIQELTGTRQLNPDRLRSLYQASVSLKARSKGKVGWAEGVPEAPAVKAWVGEIEATLDRIVAGLRELIVSFTRKGE